MVTVRDIIVGDEGTLLTLTIQPPGAHQSYVEDVVLVRASPVEHAGHIADAPPVGLVREAFRKSGAHGREAMQRDNSLFGWMNQVICWGSRSESSPPAPVEGTPAGSG